MINRLTVFVFIVSIFTAMNSWGFGEGLNRFCNYGGDSWQQKEDNGQYSCEIESSLQRDEQSVVLYRWLVYGLSVSAYKFDYQSYFNTRSKTQINDIMLRIEQDSQREIKRFFTQVALAELIEQFHQLDEQAFQPVSMYDNQQPYRYSAIKELTYQIQTGKFKGVSVTLMHERSTDQNNDTLFGSYSVRLNTVYQLPVSGYQYRFFSESLK